MSYWFPQGAATLKVVWEDFGNKVDPLPKQTYTISVVPKRVRVDINSYTEADTFDMDVDYKTFPFDPRGIRSCQVSIHMQNMEKLTGSDGKPVIIAPSKDNAIFLGFADVSKMNLDETSRTVNLTGRDYTGLYIDQIWPGETVALTLPVDRVIASIIGRLKATGDITVDNRTGSPVLPILAAFYPDFGALSGKRNARKKETYWDVIQDICAKAGLISYIELDKLVITKPRTLYNDQATAAMAYGKNLKNLEITRNFGKQKGFNIVVRSIIGKTVETVEIPKDSKTLPGAGDYIRLPKQTTNGAQIDPNQEEAIAPVIAFSVANVRDRSHLISIGEGIFEEMSRQQLEGRFSTSDMQAPLNSDRPLLGDAQCFDLLKLRNGSPIQISIENSDLKKIQTESSLAEKAQYLAERGYDKNVALILAKTLGKLTTPFYTRAVQFSLDSTSGFNVDVDFVNFIDTNNKGLSL